MAEQNRQNYDHIRGAGNLVILTRDDGTPTLVNLFRLVSANPNASGGSLLEIEYPQAVAGAGGGEYSSKEFKTVDCTKLINVKETLQEIVALQAEALKL